MVYLNDIIICKADGSYTKIFLRDGKTVLSSKGLTYYYKLLQKQQFCRCHNSYIINIAEITEYDRLKNIILILGQKIPVSRRRKSIFIDQLNSFCYH